MGGGAAWHRATSTHGRNKQQLRMLSHFTSSCDVVVHTARIIPSCCNPKDIVSPAASWDTLDLDLLVKFEVTSKLIDNDLASILLCKDARTKTKNLKPNGFIMILRSELKLTVPSRRIFFGLCIYDCFQYLSSAFSAFSIPKGAGSCDALGYE